MSHGVLWKSPFLDFSGYAALARDVLLSLGRNGLPLQAIPTIRDERFLKQMEQGEAEDLAIWSRLLNEHINSGIHIIFHPPTSWDGNNHYASWIKEQPGFNSYVGITMFETDRLPHGWADACNQMDEIWVPSNFNRKTFEYAGVRPELLQVFPFGLNADRYDPTKINPMPIPGKRGFTFLSVFQWNRRKGWDILLRAFLEAFTTKDDVCLVIRAYPDAFKFPSIRERVASFITELGYSPNNIPSIIIIDDFISDEQMPALYRSTDCFVLPTRGEGWGIPFMEAMASGLPTIATNWSSHLDFMNDQNSYLIRLDGMENVPLDHMLENPFYTLDQQWAAPSIEHTVHLMRHVYENRVEARNIGVTARKDIIASWSLERSATWIASRIQELLTNPSRRPHTPKSLGRIIPKDFCTIYDSIEHLHCQSSIKTIGVDARIFTKQDASHQSIEYYTLHHLLSLIQMTPCWRYKLFIDCNLIGQNIQRLVSYPNVTVYSIDEINAHPFDIFHVPDPMYQDCSSPMLLVPHGTTLSVTLHDLMPLVFAHEILHTWLYREQQEYKCRLEQIISSKAVVLCTSSSTLADLTSYLALPADRVKLILGGPEHHLELVAAEDKKISFYKKFLITKPFFLSVGIFDNYKNFFSTLSAFLELRRNSSVQLVVAGPEDPFKEKSRAFLSENNIEDVIFIGPISQEELEYLYSGAIALMYPSKFESFCFPVLKAMAIGCPVITSNTSSIPEIVGDAAIMCDPMDFQSLSSAMKTLLEEPSLRNELVHKGYKRSSQFTWEKTAHKTILAWKNVLNIS